MIRFVLRPLPTQEISNWPGSVTLRPVAGKAALLEICNVLEDTSHDRRAAMSLIVRILDSMDRQLAAATADGSKPRYFIVREGDWAEIGERFRSAEPSPVVGNTYKGVLVQSGSIRDDDLAVLVN